MNFNNILIAGCGNLGSQVANLLIYKFIDEIKYNTHVGIPQENYNLYLVDPDLLNSHNYPYASMSLDFFNQYVNYPKVFSLNEHFSGMTCNHEHISIHPIADKYSKNILDGCADVLCIDCRDVSEQSPDFKIKAFSDGHFSRIILNPTSKKGTKKNYIFYASAYNAISTSVNILKYIDIDFNKFKPDHNIIYDHKDDKFYGDNPNGI